METKFTKEELSLIYSALFHDSQGTWGDGRRQEIHALLGRLDYYLARAYVGKEIA